MPTAGSPTVKRRRLAAALRRHRDQAGLTLEEVAGQLEWSPGKISRIENARVSVLPRDVKYLLRVYGATEGEPEWDNLLTLAQESREKGWWHAYGNAIPQLLETYVGLEATASTVRGYEPETVPALLRTEGYCRALARAVAPRASDEQISRQAEVCLARQERLADPGGPRLHTVLGEAALRRMTGGPGVMRGQLARLAGLSRQPAVTLQILPFSAGAHAAMDGAFTILGFPDPADPTVVCVPYYTGLLYLEKPAEAECYAAMFDRVRAAALPPGPSRELIADVAASLG